MKMSELEEAELRVEFRALYRDLGYTESLQVLFELLTSSAVLAEVICEERKIEKENTGE